MSDNYVKIFTVLVCFWTFLTFFTFTLGEKLTVTKIAEFKPDSNYYVSSGSFFTDLLNTIFNWVSKLPVINVFVPLFKIMFFQYADMLNLHCQ